MEERYNLQLAPVSVSGKQLNLYTITDWDVFVGELAEKGDAYLEHFPFWVKIWEASVVLADHLVRLEISKDAEILEIGAGMGLTGLFLGAFGHNVTITDNEDEALALLKKNVAHNQLETVSVEKLDWNNPGLTQKFDIICGSELLYKKAAIEPMIAFFRKYLHPEGRVFLAHDISRKCLIQFIGMIPGRFEIQNVMKTMRNGNERHRIVVHRLHMKSAPPSSAGGR